MDISEHLWRQDIDTGFRIRQALNSMFVTGKPPQTFADELQKAIGAVRVDANGVVTGTGKKFEAYRLLYNESAHVVNQAQLQTYRDDNISEYEIIETLDKKTCDLCAGMDGKHFPVDKAVEGVNHPSFHVFCRGTTAAYIPDLSDLSTTRAARDPVTGKAVTSTADNYDDWIKQQTAKYGEKEVATQRTMAQNESADFAQYQKYKTVLKNSGPQSFADFQRLKYNDPDGWAALKRNVNARGSLQSQLSYVLGGEKQFIPQNSVVTSIKTIAGAGSDKSIRQESALISKYGGTPGEWMKKVGKIESAKYSFDVHWYERNGKQYDMKMKHRKETE